MHELSHEYLSGNIFHFTNLKIESYVLVKEIRRSWYSGTSFRYIMKWCGNQNPKFAWTTNKKQNIKKKTTISLTWNVNLKNKYQTLKTLNDMNKWRRVVDIWHQPSKHKTLKRRYSNVLCLLGMVGFFSLKSSSFRHISLNLTKLSGYTVESL